MPIVKAKSSKEVNNTRHISFRQTIKLLPESDEYIRFFRTRTVYLSALVFMPFAVPENGQELDAILLQVPQQWKATMMKLYLHLATTVFASTLGSRLPPLSAEEIAAAMEPPAEEPDVRLPVTVLSGFLGAGVLPLLRSVFLCRSKT